MAEDVPSIENLKDLDRKHLLHPFTNHPEMHAQGGTHIITSAKGIYVTDENGNSLLDGLAGLWCVNVGHGRKEIANAVHRQMEKLAFYPSFFNSTTEPTIQLAERLVQKAPDHISHVYFSNSGSEANETALKLIRAYHKAMGSHSKQKILSLTYGYHGVTLATTSMTQLPSCQVPFHLPLADFFSVPGPYQFSVDTPEAKLPPEEYSTWCLKETEAIIQRQQAKNIAALFVEPVQGAGGVIVPPPGYLKGLRELCGMYRILFVADEVICAFGRLGFWFASKEWDLRPDFITTAKGLTSGYLPLGATLISKPIADYLIQSGYLPHGFTYSGHPTACAAALANLDLLEKENLIEKTRNITGPHFQSHLQALKGHPAVGEVRGTGLIGAVELIPKGGIPARDPKAPLGPKAARIARSHGIIVRGIRDIIAIAPPLIIELSEIDFLFEKVRLSLDQLET